MDFDKIGGRRGRFRNFRAPEIDTDQIADAMPDVDLERLAKQLREIDLDRFARQLRDIDLDRFGKQIRDFDFDRFGRQVRESAEDVRDRIQGRQEPDRGVSTAALLAGVGIGAAAMYLLDPEEGRRRRALLRDQLMKAQRVTSEAMETRSRDMANRASGVAAETRAAAKRAGSAPARPSTSTAGQSSTAGQPSTSASRTDVS
jgi:gas vesicle protein